MPESQFARLEDIYAELKAAALRAQEIVAAVNPSMLGRCPHAGSWSVAEVLAHLTLTSDAYLASIRPLLEQARSNEPITELHRNLRMELSARLLAWWLEPPYRMKSRTAAAFVPAPADPSLALAEFLERQHELIHLLPQASGLALSKLRITSPFASNVRYNVYSAFKLIAVHQRRHLWQAEQISRSLTHTG